MALTNQTHTQTFSATSSITDGDKQETIVFLSAQVGTDGNPKYDQSIKDMELYKANKKECLKDINDFREYVEAHID